MVFSADAVSREEEENSCWKKSVNGGVLHVVSSAQVGAGRTCPFCAAFTWLCDVHYTQLATPSSQRGLD